MPTHPKFLERLQKRIALLAIGAATLRNQGAPLVVETARKYLQAINLKEFSIETYDQFEQVLNRHTNSLNARFPPPVDSWGGARKALNIFLRDVVYNRYLCEHYGLAPVETFLELPLDSNSYEGLREDAEELKMNVNLPAWPGVKRLKADVNKRLQQVAEEVAKQLKTLRVHLDVRYWRKEVIDALET
ncbi:MAG: hypothetical protein L0Z62_00155 [Gemmataceae bacterium]|nr:hypothetical protein [Gemmataceae bacterium]